MKKLNRNTMAADFIGAAFCLLMAFALLMLYSGCSEDSSSPINIAQGGTEEETAYALAGQVGDVVPMMLRSAGTKGSGDSSSIESGIYGGSIYAQKGAVVTLYELDSLTLEKTDRSIVNVVGDDEGQFKFDSISFNSPYVMIEVLDSCESVNCAERNELYSGLLFGGSNKIPYLLSAIVDLRHSEKVSVNLLTNAKIPFLRERYAEGLSFAQAHEAAERDFLESLGIYETLGSFEKLTDENSELAYVSALLMELELSQKVSDILEFYSWNCWLGIVPQEAFFAMGQQYWQYYLNMQKMTDYYVGYLAKKNNLARCTDAQEGDVKTIKIRKSTLSLMCRSGKWTPGFKIMEHTNGTMTDNRDGKTYKTVTYNFGEVSQTWMAENLNFADTASLSVDSALKNNLLGRTRCVEGDSSCNVNGRMYMWMSAMNIGMDDIQLLSTDTLGVKKVVDDTCKRVFLWPAEKNNKEYEFADETLRDSVMSVCMDKYFYTSFDYSKFISAERPVVHQGVCPEGWRIPNKADWDILLKNLSAYYGVNVENTGSFLIDDYATGFGLKQPAQIKYGSDGRLNTGYNFNLFAMIPDVDVGVDSIDFESFEFPEYFVHFFLYSAGVGMSNGKVYYPSPYDAPGATGTETFVRCIKN
jgi:uncharacterized protein (TIGR02145 family)